MAINSGWIKYAAMVVDRQLFLSMNTIEVVLGDPQEMETTENNSSAHWHNHASDDASHSYENNRGDI